ncbi:MAG: PD-(D/E)XK nuclease family protein [Verrucomicrobiia bacterium]
MHARFLLGPTGSGKTFRCVTEARAALQASPSGLPLVLLAPKQATFQLERLLLSDPTLPGYTRLQILSFERLAELILSEVADPPPQLLSGEGRLMVLRALLSRHRADLKLFRATAHLRGFSEQLSVVLRELQRAGLSPEQILALSKRPGLANQLDLKLHDLGSMLGAYLAWLKEHGLQDDDHLINLAAEALDKPPRPDLRFENLWLDGFAELSAAEMGFLAALLPFCDRATLAFNLDRGEHASWLSIWSSVSQTCRALQERLGQREEVQIRVEWLDPASGCNRFVQNPVLQHLERNWTEPRPYGGAECPSHGERTGDAKTCLEAPRTIWPEDTIRIAVCPNPDAEVTLAAREIRRFVRGGGHYREAAVLVRNLEGYSDPIRQVFSAFEIPFFLDRREPVGHHALSELTRSAVRTVAFHWQPDDWFGALKTGLVHDVESDIDILENEAVARGWKGGAWLKPLQIADDAKRQEQLEALRARLVAPFASLAQALGNRPSGKQLAAALTSFYAQLEVARKLEAWSTRPPKDCSDIGGRVHLTLWEQMQDWLENLAMAFARETLSLREWLPVLEAGLASQTVGVIPPTLDQVLVGAVDRSRNPELRLALVLGMNESVFPALTSESNLLSNGDREQLIGLGIPLTTTNRHQMGREQYLGYIACTRSRERLVITCASRDADDQPLNPSPFIDHLQRLFPGLALEVVESHRSWEDLEHPCELIHGTLGLEGQCALPESLAGLPAIAEVRERVAEFRALGVEESLSPRLAEGLYGPVLETSVSRLEEYGSCPFKFALTSGLHLEERRRFELDARHQGSFQHEILARFHQELRKENRRWRDLTPKEARMRIRTIAEKVVPEYEEGLLQSSEQTRYTAQALTRGLEAFMTTVIQWMAQYEFDPHSVELAFGIEEKPLPAWEIDLGEGHRLSFRGKIDRVDLWRDPATDRALCVVIDYKSSARRLEPAFMKHGIQLQLPGYLNVLRALQGPEKVFGVRELVPAGVFFVNLRGRYAHAGSRTEAFDGAKTARAQAYQHTGRFDASALRHLDNRPQAESGDQFKYRLRKNGQLYANCPEALDSAKLREMLDEVDRNLRRMGQEIYAGKIRPEPYRKGAATACDKCDYQAVCRIDPWTHLYRSLDGAPSELPEAPNVPVTDSP